ncbi:MAG: (deoxy)nucleoside triphosphate pyrophosphohydrolase [Lachnospiraceae bacterium]|nr:(deoxy)nucleoside triphosphate pyrophosphohydrolase [Lachnospiraceae bacterium]
MQTIMAVGAAIIRKRTDGKVELFVAERGHGDLEGFFEYPGGKIEPGEEPKNTAVREIREEFKAEIEVDRYIDTVDYDYPNFHLNMQVFLCHLKPREKLTLTEHTSSKWVTAEELDQVKFAPADATLVEKMKQVIGEI